MILIQSNEKPNKFHILSTKDNESNTDVHQNDGTPLKSNGSSYITHNDSPPAALTIASVNNDASCNETVNSQNTGTDVGTELSNNNSKTKSHQTINHPNRSLHPIMA